MDNTRGNMGFACIIQQVSGLKLLILWLLIIKCYVKVFINLFFHRYYQKESNIKLRKIHNAHIY
jgi:hypothetical protein